MPVVQVHNTSARLLQCGDLIHANYNQQTYTYCNTAYETNIYNSAANIAGSYVC